MFNTSVILVDNISFKSYNIQVVFPILKTVIIIYFSKIGSRDFFHPVDFCMVNMHEQNCQYYDIFSQQMCTPHSKYGFSHIT